MRNYQFLVKLKCQSSMKVDKVIAYVEGFGPSLLDRNWLSKLNIWKSICLLRVSSREQSIEILVDKFPNVFREALGTIKTSKASLEVKTVSRPRFYRAHSLLFALKGAIEEELVRMKTLGVLKLSITLNGLQLLFLFPNKMAPSAFAGLQTS